MLVKVKRLGGTTFEVELNPEDTVSSVSPCLCRASRVRHFERLSLLAQVAEAKKVIQAAESGFEAGLRLVFSGKVRCAAASVSRFRHHANVSRCQVLEEDKPLASYNIEAKPFLVALPSKASVRTCSSALRTR